MPVIFKRQKLSDAIESIQAQHSKRGTRKNLIGASCLKCGMIFETLKRYRKQTCVLCRYEHAAPQSKKKFLEERTEEELYTYQIARSIFLFNRKMRMLKAANCKISNVNISKRLSDYEDLLEV